MVIGNCKKNFWLPSPLRSRGKQVATKAFSYAYESFRDYHGDIQVKAHVNESREIVPCTNSCFAFIACAGKSLEPSSGS